MGGQRAAHAINIEMFMEHLSTLVHALLCSDLLTKLLCSLLGVRLETNLESRGELVGGKLLEGDWIRASVGSSNHGAPERLIAEKWDDHGRFAGFDTGSGRASTSVMHNCSDSLEEPVMGHVTKHIDSIRHTNVVSSETTPSLGDERADTGFLDGFEDHGGHGVRIVNDNGTKADVNRWWTTLEKFGQARVRRERRGEVKKIEAGDVKSVAPVVWLGDQSR